MIQLHCECGKRLTLPESNIGRRSGCPGCKRVLTAVAPEYESGAGLSGSKLVVEDGPERRGEQIFLGGGRAIEIGKDAGRDIVLRGSTISRAHCRLTFDLSGWRVDDLRSTNGLFVNGERVAKASLKNGDVIRVGEFELRYLGGAKSSPRPVAQSKPVASAADSGGGSGILEDIYEIAAPKAEPPKPRKEALSEEDEAARPTCPSCKKKLAPRAKICVTCGIDLRTGRSLITAQATNLDEIYIAAESVIQIVSWFIWFGIYPIASEAYGAAKPYVIRSIAVITIVTSAWFWSYDWTDSPTMMSAKNRLLWAGDAPPSDEMIEAMYNFTSFGDSDAFWARYAAIEASVDEDEEVDEPDKSIALTAHESLPPERQCFGTYHASQLVTHAFLHGGLVHLASNLVFLLVFGSRVNALIGTIGTIILYPVLAVLSALVFMASMHGEPPIGLLGASGAIMGLAGMYFVLFPLHKVHVAAWMRWGIIRWFELSLRIFDVRGFWVVLFYIAFDVVYIAIESDDGVAHWAHVGGFASGALIALLLLLTRRLDCGGGDILSALLGRRAWALIGRPGGARVNDDPGTEPSTT